MMDERFVSVIPHNLPPKQSDDARLVTFLATYCYNCRTTE